MPKSLLILLLFYQGAACSDAADTTEDREPLAQREQAEDERSGDRGLSCGIEVATLVTGDGLGHLRVGKPASEIGATCRIIGDSMGLDAEAMRERRLSVDLGRDTVEAVIADDRVWRIHLTGKAFRAAGDLGVGSTVADLRSAGSAHVALGEGIFILLPERCGLSFRLDNVRYGPNTTVDDLPANARVVEVLVFGCTPPRP